MLVQRSSDAGTRVVRAMAAHMAWIAPRNSVTDSGVAEARDARANTAGEVTLVGW